MPKLKVKIIIIIGKVRINPDRVCYAVHNMHARFNVRPPVNVETINHPGIRQLSFGRDLCRTEVQKPLRSPTSR